MPARTPEDCDRLFGERANAGDFEGIVDLYEDGASMVQQDGTVATGRTAIRAAIAVFAEMKPHFDMNVTRVVRAGDDLAVLYNEWTMTAKGPDGNPFEMQGRALEVVRRQADGTWRFAVDDPFARGSS